MPITSIFLLIIYTVIPYGAEVGPPLPSTPAPPSTVPPVVIPAGPANCDFEGGLCSYSHDSEGDFEWIRKRGYTDTPDTGPDTDHTHLGALGKNPYIIRECFTKILSRT